jgi:hypothetical protein
VDQFEEFATGHSRDLTIADLQKDRGLGCRFELREYISDERHGFSG